ncbi:MAG: YihY/virulence factor BrkB family protein [Thermonemataceae bacterium]|nr:YihY/virulence factor BrkB family protein [Thermonemataceae bacterium]
MQKKIDKYILSKNWYQKIENKLHNVEISKKTPISWYLFLQIFFNNIINNSLQIRASAVAFSLTLSLFPFLLFLITLIPYTPLEYKEVFNFMRDNLPKEIFLTVESTINDIMLHKRSDLLSVSFIFTLYAATNGMAALIQAFNSVFRYAEKRSFLKQRMVALLLTLIVSFIFLFSVLALIISRFLMNMLTDWGFLENNFSLWGLLLLKYVLVFLVFWIAISAIYYIAPASHEKWSFFSSGSLLTAFLAIVITNFFSFYLENFASYNKLYGSIGTFIALMVWIYLLAFVLMLGFEVNASLMEARKTKPKPKAFNEDFCLED